MTRHERPAPAVYLLVEAGLILGLAYFTFIGGALTGLYLYGPRSISQAIIGMVAGVWLAGKWLRRRPWPVTPLDRPLLATLAAVVMATIFSIHPRLSLESALVIFTYALAFWFVYEHIQAAWFADLLLKCLFIVAGIVCLIAGAELVRWYFGLPNGPSWPSLGLGIWPSTVPRIGNASLGSPNLLAGYLALLIPLTLAQGLASHRKAQRLGLWLLAVLMLCLIGISRSRAGVMGTLGGVMALVVGGWPGMGERWPWMRPTRRRMAGLALLLVGGFVGLTVMLALSSRMGTARVRLDMWSAALQMGVHRPLLGVGPGVFGLEYLRYRDTSQFSEVHAHAHNIYLHTLATLGILGTLASGWLVYRLVATVRRLWPSEEDKARQWTRLGALAGLVAFATDGLFETFLIFPAVFYIVIILAALALRPASPRPAPPRAGRWWLKPGVATILMAAGIGIAVWSDSGFAAFDRAMAASRRGDGAATIKALQTAIRRDPAYDYYRLQLGLAYGQLAADDPGYLPDAIAAYRAAGIEHDNYALNHANLAWLLWEAGDREAALAEMTRAVELEQITPDYQLNLGLMLEEAGQLEAAHMAYAQAIAHVPSLLELDFWDEGQPAARRRERLIETAQALMPSRAAYYLGNYDQAVDRLETALRASPRDATLWLELGQVWLARDNPAQALDAARQARTLGAPLGGVFGLSARARLALGELDAAAADLEVVRFLSPGYGAHMLSGQLAEARGDREGAAAAYQAAIGSALLARAVNYGPWVWGRPPLAGDTLPFMQQPALAESLVKAYLALGELYAREGMVSEARAAFEAVLALNPNQLEARMGLEALP